MRDLEIDLNNPLKPILWVRGKAIERHSWNKVKARELISDSPCYGSKKESAKKFYNYYGVPASTCAKYFNSGIIKMSVGAVEGHEALCYSRNQFSSKNTINVCEMKDELDLALKDGIKNITPFIACFKKSPQELKKFFGEHIWKTVCKNSFSHNKGIAQAFSDRNDPSQPATDLKMLVKVPSSIFKRIYPYGIEVATYLNKKCGIPIKSIRGATPGLMAKAHTIADTRRMAETYGQSFSFDWSWRKMQEKHNEFVNLGKIKEFERLKAENEKYSLVLREGKQKVWELDGVKATFIDTYLGILEEGTKMHHCVGFFAQSCYNDSYAVLHLEGDGEETTLGVSAWGKQGEYPSGAKRYVQSQHYGIANAIVKSGKHKALADYVIECLNKEQNDCEKHDD